MNDEPRIADGAELFGEDMLCFIANLTTEEFAAVRDDGPLPDGERGAVLGELLGAAAVLATRPHPQFLVGNLCIGMGGDESPVQQWLRRAGRTVAPSPTSDPVLAELRALAVDLYPLLLMPRGELPFGHTGGAAYQHPRHKALVEVLRADPAISRLVPGPTEKGALVMVYRSTGSGSSVQVEMLGETLVNAGWDRLRARGVRDLAALEAAIDEVVATLRSAAAGRPATCPALLAFAGLTLPHGVDEVVLPFGRLRRAREADRWLFPAGLTGGLEATDEAGTRTRIDYAGDVVLETAVPYVVQVDLDNTEGWPANLSDGRVLWDRADTLSLAAALGIVRTEVTVIGSTWNAVFDPLAVAPQSGYRDARSYRGLSAVAPTAAEMADVAQWVTRIDAAQSASIAVGIRRTLSSLRERNDAADSLVDGVIAWENMFGTGQGEITFRVSMAMARLLSDSEAGREALRDEVATLYSLRSKVVHGAHIDQARIGFDARRAREITLEMWRVIFRDEPGLIALKERARALLLRR
jgi:hypothetical protein